MGLLPSDMLIITSHLSKQIPLWKSIVLRFHLTNHYWWSHHGCSWNPVKIILFDNFQVIANTNLELSGILSYCIWVYIMFRYHNWYLNSQMWLDKSVMSRALTSPKKQLETLSVSSLIRKKQSTHNSFLYYCLYCAKINKQKYFLPKICGRLFISLTYQSNFTQIFIL